MENMQSSPLFTEGIDYPAQKADADSEDIVCDDPATLAAQQAFHITYLYPWQRIVIANILDSATTITQIPHGDSDENNSTPYIDPCTALYNDSTDYNNSDDSASDTSSQSCTCCTTVSSQCESECIPEKVEPQQSDLFCNGHQIVLLPTGAGKSLCFLVPALLLNGPTLVLYPLLALMADQKRRMDDGNMVSVVFRGQQTDEEREENFRKIHEGAKIILANPEVLQNKTLVKRLAECNIAHIAIDEAHCVSEWGDSFRPAYLTLGTIIKELHVPVVTAFTATASPQVLARVAEVLFDGEAHIVRSDSDRPNIHYTVVNTYAKKRTAFKLAITMEKPLIIFCGTRKHAESMARELGAYYGSDRVKFYHAGLEKEEKTAVEKWFYPKKDAVLCCTCAFGMGVDKKDIHAVIHLDAPATAEAYLQEAGRGGRDGSIAQGILLWSHTDSLKTAQFPEGSRERVLKTFAESSTCRRQVLLDALGGEQAACDGCDVCERHGPAPFAEDALFVLSYIHRHRRLYNRDELYGRLEGELNKRDRKQFGMNIWEHSDVAEILMQLESEGYIRTCLWPWYKRIDCAAKKQSFVSPVYHSVHFQKLFCVQETAVSFIKRVKKLLHAPEQKCIHLARNFQRKLIQSASIFSK